MSEQLFDVVFFGILQTGKDKETVLHNMAAVFKTDANKLAPYFTGGRKVIKGNVNVETANKYQAALENIGLVIKVEACEIEQDKTPSDVSDDKTSSSSTQSSHSNDSITMAPVGADVIEHPAEKAVQEIADISNVSMAEVGADVIENPTSIPAQEIDDISGITIADAGSDVLENPTAVVTQEIDELTDVSLAEAGADLIENPKPVPTANIPDTSELSLNEEIEK